jgi:hypothetical protein
LRCRALGPPYRQSVAHDLRSTPNWPGSLRDRGRWRSYPSTAPLPSVSWSGSSSESDIIHSELILSTAIARSEIIVASGRADTSKFCIRHCCRSTVHNTDANRGVVQDKVCASPSIHHLSRGVCSRGGGRVKESRWPMTIFAREPLTLPGREEWNDRLSGEGLMIKFMLGILSLFLYSAEARASVAPCYIPGTNQEYGCPCPSSNALRQFTALLSGGSGSSVGLS